MRSTAAEPSDLIAAEERRRRAWDAIAAAALRFRAASLAWEAASARAGAAGLSEAAASDANEAEEQAAHAAEWALEVAIDGWYRLTGSSPDDR